MARAGPPSRCRWTTALGRVIVAAGLCLAVAGSAWAQPGADEPTPAADTSSEAGSRLQAAVGTENATRTRLGVLGDAFSCADARFVAYRRSDAESELTDQWYVASQLWADAALLAVFDARAALTPADWSAAVARCHVDKGFIFLDRLWDYSAAGYFPRSNPVGTQVDRSGPRFADDNALAGLALLATAATEADPLARQRYVHAARREADFLQGSGLWDDTFGGGFWWNTNRGDSAEGKPAQTQAIAALFFARLYQASGEASDREWALRTLLWLDTVLYDPSRQLYRWSAAYQDPAHRSGPAVLSTRVFNYDQGIAVEAQIAAAQLDADMNRLTRARGIARALRAGFWSEQGFDLELGVGPVYTGYSAWAGLGYLALYDVDHDPAWLDAARADADALTRTAGEPDGGYALRVFRCVDRKERGCESGQLVVVDHTRDTAAQAWAQQLETAIAQRLSPAADESPPEMP